MHHLVENCCENYTDDPKDTKLIDEIANNLPHETKFMKNKSAMEKCLVLARDKNSDPVDDTASSDLFIPDVDPEPNPMASEGPVTVDNPVWPDQDLVEVPPADGQPASVEFDLLDLETAGLMRSGKRWKPTWKLADSINKKLKIALRLLSFVVLRTSMAHTYAYSVLRANKIHKAISMHARMIIHIEIINLNADATYSYMHPLSYATKNGDNEVYYLYTAMQQEDREDFIIAMQKEVEDHCCRGHWKPVLRNTIGDNMTVRSV